MVLPVFLELRRSPDSGAESMGAARGALGSRGAGDSPEVSSEAFLFFVTGAFFTLCSFGSSVGLSKPSEARSAWFCSWGLSDTSRRKVARSAHLFDVFLSPFFVVGHDWFALDDELRW